MSIISPTELKKLCEKYNLNPSKKYGQNYLTSDVPIKKMIEAADFSFDDTVVEIGPGFGILTLSMAPMVKKVIAFEIEKKLLPFWHEVQKKVSNIELVWGNALEQLEIQNEKFKENYKVVANLPYQITSHVLRTLLELPNQPERIIVMVQKEVAERICAKPGDMSMLAVSVQYYGEPSIIARVSKGNFWPMPQVDSAVLSIKITNKYHNSDATSRFFKVVKAGFASKRKQLWHNLVAGLGINKEQAKNIILEVTGNDKIRAEDLSMDQWMEVVDRFRNLE